MKDTGGARNGDTETSKGGFLVRDNRVLNGPLSRLLRSFTRTAHSTHSLRSAPQRSAALRSALLNSLAHFAHFLTGQWKFMNMCSRCERVSEEQTRFLSSLETRSKSEREREDLRCEFKVERQMVGRKTESLHHKVERKMEIVITGK